MAFDIRETAFKLPENWKLVRLGDIAKVNEKSLTKKSQPDFIRYIDISSVSTGAFDTPKLLKKDEIPSRAKRILRNNDFIISTVRPNLKQFSFIEEAQENLIASTGFCVISSNNSKLAWYLYSLITSDLFTEYLVKIADGGAYPAFNPKEIEDAIIPLPDKDNLEFISDTSRFFHKKIQLNTQINQTLEQIAQALFKSWFVDFDPVRAKVQALSDGLSLEQAELAAMQAISGKTPEELTALSQTQPDHYAELAETAKAFPCEMMEVDGVEVPKGWEVKELGSLMTIKRGGSPRPIKDFISDKGLNWVKISDATAEDNPFLFSTKEYIKSEGLSKTVLLKKGSLILSNSATPGLPRFLELDACIHDGWLYFSDIKSLTQEYLYFFFLNIRKDLVAQGNGSVFTNLKTDIVKAQKAIVPDERAICYFDKQVKSIMNLIRYNTANSVSLKETRDLLLPRLLNGELNG
ncbi:restriction endonuclease subunit S [Haemophilus haemolyticus]|uniref:restriction endonuclease subunit S n=1 Tax=Haemophilus haemolyticus TaxID=726 RepID=UPI000E58197F|nr:restriction endonuclease subunit S [Haemophilus haemolyticus]